MKKLKPLPPPIPAVLTRGLCSLGDRNGSMVRRDCLLIATDGDKRVIVEVNGQRADVSLGYVERPDGAKFLWRDLGEYRIDLDRWDAEVDALPHRRRVRARPPR